MIRNYLKIAYRNLLKNKVFSLINILGLAIGMAACLLILRYVVFESSYDSFHRQGNRLYRVALQSSIFGNATDVSVANHPGVGRTLQQDFPEVTNFTRLFPISIWIETLAVQIPGGGREETYIEENAYVADTSFLSLFSFPLLEGDPASALRERNTVVLTAATAQKYFGTTDVVGRTLYMDGDDEAMPITGVLADIPENTHLHFDMLVSAATMSGLDANSEAQFNWKWPEFYTYVQLAPGTDPAALEAKFPAFIDRHMGAIEEQYKFTTRFFLQPVADIHLQSNYLKEIKSNNSQTIVTFLLLIGCLIVLIAWVNYVNLSTAKATERAREVGIRKVAGAHRRELIIQFLLESLFINGVAILLAMVIVHLVWPYFQQLTGRSLDNTFGWWLQAPFSLILLGFLFVGTLLSGLYPAFILSAFRPLQVLKGKLYHAGSSRSGRRITLRQGLIVFQFLVSIVLMAGTLGAYQQLRYMRNQSLGFDQEQLLIVKAPSLRDSTFIDKSDALKTEWQQNATVGEITLSSEIPGKEIKAPTDFRRASGSSEDLKVTYVVGVDEDFLPTYNMQLVAGRFFDKNRPADEGKVVLNEQAVALLGYTSPEEALGQRVYVWRGGDFEGEIIGVLANYHQRSLDNAYDPILMLNDDFFPNNYFSLKVNTDDLGQTIDHIEAEYARFFPNNPVEYFFLNDFFDQQYRADQRFGQIFTLFAVLAIFIACLGLFGLATYTAQHRTKEIGIRKVMGASVASIVTLLSQDFIKLVFVASLLALPLAYFALYRWLESYAFRIEVQWWFLVIPVVVVLIIALFTVSFQTIKAAVANPVEALRSE